eukprot:jgi/Botrbrau1/9935/Bobra.0012s0032.1
MRVGLKLGVYGGRGAARAGREGRAHCEFRCSVTPNAGVWQQDYGSCILILCQDACDEKYVHLFSLVPHIPCCDTFLKFVLKLTVGLFWGNTARRKKCDFIHILR